MCRGVHLQKEIDLMEAERNAIADLLHYTYKHQHEEQSTEQRTKGQKLE